MVTLHNTGERPYSILDPGQDPRRLVVIKPDGTAEMSEQAAAVALKERKDLKKVSAAKAGAS